MIFVDSIFENIVLPVISKEVQAYRIQKKFESARDLLSAQSAIQCKKGLSLIRRLCQDNPVNLQEHIDVICRFIREKAAPQQTSFGTWQDLIRSSLVLVCSLPRYDQNNWSYNLDLSNLHLENLVLQRLNLENAILCDSSFHKVDFARSSFKNSDLGGCSFEASSSLEWCDFDGALMNCSPLTHNVTSFYDTWLWGCNLDKAKIDVCRVQVVDGFDLKPALERHGGRIEDVSTRPKAA